jgi:hypothetical protein
MEIKMHEHNFRRMFFDILRDTNTAKYSMTKFAALVGFILLTATIIVGLVIMCQKGEIDHVFIVELIGFVLTLLGFKNSFGFKGNGQTITTNGNNDNNSAITNEDTKGRMGDGQHDEDTKGRMGDGQHDEDSMVCTTVNPKEQADFVNDTLKG